MSSQDKLVSFVVPVYKTENYLEKCLNSLLNQDYPFIEIYCVLDGENPKAEKIIRKLREKNKKILGYKVIEHSGAPKARNVGYDYVKGDYVSFWDSDCYAMPGMVRMWIKAFTQFDVDFVYSGYRFNDKDETYIPSEPFNPYLLTCNNYIATMFPMKREIFCGFDSSLKSLQDWDLWLTLTEKGYKGYMLEGTGFTTEMRQGISSEGCKADTWLERYEAVRNKHGIKNRDICFTSALHRWRGISLAEMFGQDYKDMPSQHPNKYKVIYNLGFYSNTMQLSSQVFKNAPMDCKRIIHWFGDDIETILQMPYLGVKQLAITLNKTIHKHYCENETTRQMLKELGIKAIVRPLPMSFTKLEKSKEFKVYYEFDSATTHLIKEIIKANPDIKFESEELSNLKDYACFLSLTGSKFPSENLKRFILAGRYVITNYDELYAGKVELDKEKIVRRIRECKKGWERYKGNKDAISYYSKILNPDNFIRGLK